MIYSEAAYFDGNHCQHVADREEHIRLEKVQAKARALSDRRRGSPHGNRS